ncbi:MAG: hypothetical protein QOE68_275 [Thermoanaerobaculia bacterium]|jgi:hypothetical protein|nr:hypothetical protein [Thermoanaerobaculia bacterium]
MGVENHASYEVNASPFTRSVEDGMRDAFSKLFAALDTSN